MRRLYRNRRTNTHAAFTDAERTYYSSDWVVVSVCAGCGKHVDPEVCNCGVSMFYPWAHEGHTPVMMGCDCYRTPP